MTGPDSVLHNILSYTNEAVSGIRLERDAGAVNGDDSSPMSPNGKKLRSGTPQLVAFLLVETNITVGLTTI